MSQLTLDQPGTDVATSRPAGVIATFDRGLGLLQSLLNRYSVGFLRVSLGLVFLAFGVLKFFPGLSPAEDIAAATIDRLTFGLIGGETAVLMTAVLETFIGLTLVTGKFVRLGLVVLAGAFVGIVSPLVLFTMSSSRTALRSWASTSSRTSSSSRPRSSSPPALSDRGCAPTRTPESD